MENRAEKPTEQKGNAKKLLRRDIAIGFFVTVWLANSLILTHWFFHVAAVINLLYTGYALCVLLKKGITAKRIGGVQILLTVMLMCVAVTTLVRGSSMRTAYLLLEINPLIALLLLFCTRKDYINDRTKSFICKGFYALMTLTALCILIFERNGFSDRAHITVLPGLVMNSNILSYPLVLAMLIETHYALRQKKRVNLLLNGLSIAVMLAAVLAMRSRGAFLALVASVGIMLLTEVICGKGKVKKRAVATLLPMVAAAVLVLILALIKVGGSEIVSDSGRFDLWKIALDRWKANPLIGAGNGTDYGGFLTSHNWFFDILSQFGLPFFLLYVALFSYLTKRFIKSPLLGFIMFSLVQSMIDCGSMTQIIALAFAVLLSNESFDCRTRRVGRRLLYE